MDLIASCKDKLAYFRIKELKDVLTQLGLSKQGKKQDLIDRVLAIISDDQVFKTWTKKHGVSREHVAKLVDDTFRKMKVSGAPDLASKGQSASESNHVKIEGEVEESFQKDTKVRCLCGGKLETEPIIKCEDRRCHVWQHIGCVIIPEKPLEGNPPIPDVFYCEICRLNRADPFWVSVAHPLYPVKLSTSHPPPDGTNPVQSIDRTFQLTRVDKDLLSKSEYDLQAWCMLLNDKVPFRMQWPQYTDLQVNGMAVRAINRPGSQLLGANGRDDGPIITQYTKDGINKICLTGCDARIFCLGVRIVKRRTMQQIMNMIPKEADGELFEDALARVRRCVSGGNATDNADSDSDIEVVADSFSINLRCPMSGSRMKVAGRFKPCVHMGCFDLEVFVEMNQRSRKWQCPICLKNYTLEHIIIDPYFNQIACRMRHCGEDITEIEVKPDCSWRVKTKTESERRELLDLAQWHFPDGRLSSPETEIKPKAEALKQIKQEGVSEGHTGLKIGIRKRNGFWEVSKHEDVNTSSGSRLHENVGVLGQKVIPMSSTATGSGRDGDDPSVNQDGGAHFDFPTSNGMEMDSLSLNAQSAYGFPPHNPSSAGNAEVIVLSDSDEENDMLISSGATYKNTQNDGGVGYTLPPSGINDPFPETLGNSSGLGLYNPNEDDIMSLWPLHPGSQTGFQLFGSDAGVSDALIHLQQGPVNCSNSVNGYELGHDASIGPSSLFPDVSAGLSDADLNGGLVDNPLAFPGEDPSLQIFLPTRPSDATIQPDMIDQADVSNGVRNEDWISLRLGDGASGNHEESATPDVANSGPQIPSSEASLLLGISDNRSDKANRPRSDSPFSFPRQKRSVRPRLYLSIDSDSD